MLPLSSEMSNSFFRERLLGLGVSMSGVNSWTFSDERSCASRFCQRQLDYVERLKAMWREDGWLRLPAEWMLEDHEAPLPEHNDYLPEFNFAVATAPVRDHVRTLERSEILDRHFANTRVFPDFCLNVHHHSDIRRELSVEETFSPNTDYSKRLISEFLLYNGSEGSAERSISCLLAGIPSCWYSCDPAMELPSVLCTTPPHTACSFALLYHPLASFTPLYRQRDRNIRVSVSHPLLLAGMKGPMPWCSGAEVVHIVSREALLRDLSSHIQPSLAQLLISWQLQQIQKQDNDSKSNIPQLLPEDAVIFGILFDSSKVELVAHIPYYVSESEEDCSHLLRYLSYTVDTLDFPAVPSDDDEITGHCIASRLQVALALLTIQRHTFRLTRFWDGVRLPQRVCEEEDTREEISLGPVLERPRTPEGSYDPEYDYISGDDNDQRSSDTEVHRHIPVNPEYLATIEEWRIRVQESPLP